MACLAVGRVVVSWVERYQTEALTYTTPLVRTALDPSAEHYGLDVGLADGATTAKRVPLVYFAQEEMLYAGNNRLTCKASTYTTAKPRYMTTGDLELLSYRSTQRPWSPSRLELTLLDPSGLYKGLGTLGQAARPLKPWSTVLVKRGYRTAVGNESIQMEPFYVTQVRYTQGLEPGRILLTCTNGLGLLEMWRPQRAYHWFGRSINWLLQELCAKVGLSYSDDGSAPFNRELPDFSLAPRQNGFSAVIGLLRLAAAVPRVDADGVIVGLPWPPDVPEVATVGNQAEILRGEYGLASYSATSVIVSSLLGASAADNIAEAQFLGIRLPSVYYDQRILDADHAEEVRDALLALYAAGGRSDRVVIPLRPELELWDTIALHADPDLVPADARERVVATIGEEYDAQRGVYTSEVTLQGA